MKKEIKDICENGARYLNLGLYDLKKNWSKNLRFAIKDLMLNGRRYFKIGIDDIPNDAKKSLSELFN